MHNVHIREGFSWLISTITRVCAAVAPCAEFLPNNCMRLILLVSVINYFTRARALSKQQRFAILLSHLRVVRLVEIWGDNATIQTNDTQRTPGSLSGR